MRKITKLFINIKTEQDWLARQKGWKLVKTNGVRYIFEECSCEYNYEYIYFDKSKKELEGIRNQIIDRDIEFVCHSSSWALFRKNAAKGEIHVYADNYIKYKILMKKYNTYMALGACYLCLGSSQTAVASTVNGYFRLSSILFYLCSFLFFMTSYCFKKYSLEYDDGSYAGRMKKEKRGK
ncbi:MAG: hypothetical protein K0S71_1755 [Clostridia bacterium]|jgi:hypothetical protein|nr:hypothetical protein [Clostridia bacterium]